MKWMLVLASFSSFSLFAATQWGSECGLTDSKDETWVSSGKVLDLAKASDARINALPSLTKQQIIITAKDTAADFGSDPKNIKSTAKAVELLRDHSESRDLQVYDYIVKKVKYTEVTFWPGGNPYGHIFHIGTTHVVALNEDGSIKCK